MSLLSLIVLKLFGFIDVYIILEIIKIKLVNHLLPYNLIYKILNS